MNAVQKPTRRMLVGAAFLLVYLCFSIGIALSSSPSDIEQLSKVKDFHNNFIKNEIYDKQNSEMGQLKLPDNTITFPWASRSRTGFTSTHPQKETIVMSGAQSEKVVQDLLATNAVKQRDIIYNESQKTNPKSKNLSNSMDLHIMGIPSDKDQNNYPEPVVDNMLTPDSQNTHEAQQSHSNYMNIEVSGITVNAINTVEDGSAVATSNIIINPVQIIGSTSQAKDKI